jgi:GT2 family glycosyltransferase
MGRLVSVVLVTWNSARFLPRALEGLGAQTHGHRELLVVDNASVDGSADLLQRLAPDARLIRNETNRGFSAAVNQALAVAGGELVLFLNPDAFLLPDYIAQLADALERAGPSFGSATGKLLRATGDAITPTGAIDSKGIRMTRSGRHFDIGQGQADGAEVPSAVMRETGEAGVYEVFGVSGAAALHRMTFLRESAVGAEILDEDFFAFREDADLSWRGRLSGWRALYVSHALACHVRSVTPAARRQLSAAVNLHSVKNRFLLRIKNEGAYLAIRNAPFELARDLVAIVATLTVERSSLPALVWVWKNRRRMWSKRHEVQARRRVSDRELASWFR